MGALGDLLELVFDPKFNCVSARVTTSIDLEGQRRVFARDGGAMAFTSIGGDPQQAPPATIDSVVDSWLHRDGRFRLDYGEGSGSIGNTDTQVVLRPGQPALRLDRSPGPATASEIAFQPSSLLSGYGLELGDVEVVDGRPGLVVRGRQRNSGMPIRPSLVGVAPLTETVDFVFDRVAGVLLRMAAYDEGDTVATLELSNVAFDDDVDLSAFDLPAGLEVRTEAEDLLQRFSDDGIDISTLDPTDLDGLHRAFMNHHRTIHGFGTADRRARYQPTGPPPHDEAAAREEITKAFEGFVDRDADGRAVNIQGGGNLGPSLDRAAERFPGPTTVTVTDLLFLDAHQAVVWFEVAVNNGPTVSPEGRALLIDGRWVAARETIGALLSSAGIHIPAPE